jgi:hypothetical protein
MIDRRDAEPSRQMYEGGGPVPEFSLPRPCAGAFLWRTLLFAPAPGGCQSGRGRWTSSPLLAPKPGPDLLFCHILTDEMNAPRRRFRDVSGLVENAVGGRP